MIIKFRYPLYIPGIYQVYTASRKIHGIYMVYTDYIPRRGSRCTIQYIVPVINTSDVLEDVLDVLTSNTSCNTSQYILQWFGYIPIHPACIGMYWISIHPIYPSIHPPRFANVHTSSGFQMHPNCIAAALAGQPIRKQGDNPGILVFQAYYQMTWKEYAWYMSGIFQT